MGLRKADHSCHRTRLHDTIQAFDMQTWRSHTTQHDRILDTARPQDNSQLQASTQVSSTQGYTLDTQNSSANEANATSRNEPTMQGEADILSREEPSNDFSTGSIEQSENLGTASQDEPSRQTEADELLREEPSNDFGTGSTEQIESIDTASRNEPSRQNEADTVSRDNKGSSTGSIEQSQNLAASGAHSHTI